MMRSGENESVCLLKVGATVAARFKQLQNAVQKIVVTNSYIIARVIVTVASVMLSAVILLVVTTKLTTIEFRVTTPPRMQVNIPY